MLRAAPPMIVFSILDLADKLRIPPSTSGKQLARIKEGNILAAVPLLERSTQFQILFGHSITAIVEMGAKARVVMPVLMSFLPTSFFQLMLSRCME